MNPVSDPEAEVAGMSRETGVDVTPPPGSPPAFTGGSSPQFGDNDLVGNLEPGMDADRPLSPADGQAYRRRHARRRRQLRRWRRWQFLAILTIGILTFLWARSPVP